VNISSIKVYSHLNSNPISAETEPRPMSPYGLAKLAAERFLDAYFYRCDFSLSHLRLCSVASYGEHPSQILSQLFDSAYKKKTIRINTGHTMNLLYIDHAVDLIINAALHTDKLTCVLAPPSIVVDEIATRFEKISGKKLNAEYIDLNPGIVDPVFQSDIIRFDARWIRRTSLDSMIRKIIDYNLSDSLISGGFKVKSHSNGVDRPAYHGDNAYG
jgi:nucleoside-diphosphate-sugar epimerase